MSNKKSILIAEDDKVSQLALKRAFCELGIKHELKLVGDGEAAISFLNNLKEALPCIIILDINMPKMDGIETLREIKSNEVYKNIPVLFLTTSNNDTDKKIGFELGVSGYFVKPPAYEQFLELIKSIQNYWACSKFPSID